MAARVRISEGWLRVPYSGNDLSRVEIAVGEREPDEWRGAFLSWDGRQRVAQIRPPEPARRPLKVWLRVNNVAEMIGSVHIV